MKRETINISKFLLLLIVFIGIFIFLFSNYVQNEIIKATVAWISVILVIVLAYYLYKKKKL